jgi:hypothetical protein
MKNVFKITDRVYSFPFGWGYVEDVSDERNYVRILFDSGNSCDFRDKGYETISFTEYTLEGFSQERPEELPKKGDIVWVRNEFPSEWEIGYFFKKQGNTYYTSASKNSQGWRGAGLEIRTTNPYSNEQ